MNLREFKAAVAAIPDSFDEDEVWANHPEYQIMWGPIKCIHEMCVTPELQRVVMISSPEPEWVAEDREKSRVTRAVVDKLLKPLERWDHFDGESFRDDGSGEWIRYEDVVSIMIGETDEQRDC